MNKKMSKKQVTHVWNEDAESVSTTQQEILEIKRSLYTQDTFDHTYKPHRLTSQNMSTLMSTLYHSFTHFDFKTQLYKRVPALKWIREYKLKEYLLSDILSGITVGIMNITQGIAYGILAGLSAEYGLYTSLFGALIYWLFGTSPHITIGAYGPVSIMVASTINKLSDKYVPPVGFNESIEGSSYLSADSNVARVMIASAQCFWVGLFHFLMAIFQFSFVSAYMSEPMVKGFTAATAIHVCASQLSGIFGLKQLSVNQGYFKVFRILYQLFKFIAHTNVATLIISLVSILLLSLFKFKLTKLFQKAFIIPFPIELLVVILTTVATFYGKFNDKYKVAVIGQIPRGLPTAQVPPLWLIKDIALDSFIISLITFAINFSCADIFATKFKYKINTTQELLSSGLSNIFASFFSSFTGSASLSRTFVQVSSGGKTQVVSLVSSAILMIVLYTLNGVFFYSPKAVISSIVFVALLSPIIKLKQLGFYWKVNKIEFFQFLVTFLAILILDVDIGIIIGLCFYVFMNIARQSRPTSILLGHIDGTELYKDKRYYADAHEFDGIKIIRMESSLHYTNSKTFKKAIYSLSGVAPQDFIPIEEKTKEDDQERERTFIKCLINKIRKKGHAKQSFDFEGANGGVIEMQHNNSSEQSIDELKLRYIIIDCSALNYIDTVGVRTLEQLIHDYHQIDVQVLLAECNDNVLNRFRRMFNIHGSVLSKKLIYLTIHDAVVEALNSNKTIHMNSNQM